MDVAEERLTNPASERFSCQFQAYLTGRGLVVVGGPGVENAGLLSDVPPGHLLRDKAALADRRRQSYIRAPGRPFELHLENAFHTGAWSGFSENQRTQDSSVRPITLVILVVFLRMLETC